MFYLFLVYRLKPERLEAANTHTHTQKRLSLFLPLQRFAVVSQRSNEQQQLRYDNNKKLLPTTPPDYLCASIYFSSGLQCCALGLFPSWAQFFLVSLSHSLFFSLCICARSETQRNGVVPLSSKHFFQLKSKC